MPRGSFADHAEPFSSHIFVDLQCNPQPSDWSESRFCRPPSRSESTRPCGSLFGLHFGRFLVQSRYSPPDRADPFSTTIFVDLQCNLESAEWCETKVYRPPSRSESTLPRGALFGDHAHPFSAHGFVYLRCNLESADCPELRVRRPPSRSESTRPRGCLFGPHFHRTAAQLTAAQTSTRMLFRPLLSSICNAI